MTRLNKRGKSPLTDKYQKSCLRIVDANLNRSAEGLRVCEDIARFVLNDKALAVSFKVFRHKLKALRGRISSRFDILSVRNVRKDIGRKTKKPDSIRKDFSDIFGANAQRVKEALRSLEEITKLIDLRLSENFKKMRFKFYEAEKKTVKKISALRDNR